MYGLMSQLIACLTRQVASINQLFYYYYVNLLSCLKDKNKYEVSTNQWKTTDDLINIYSDLLQAHPSVTGLIDPFHSKVW